MNFTILEMLYSTPEVQDLSYQIYRQMPERIEREELLSQVWQDCELSPDPEIQTLFRRLEAAGNLTGALQDRAAFFAGACLVWRLIQELDCLTGYPAPSPHHSGRW